MLAAMILDGSWTAKRSDGVSRTGGRFRYSAPAAFSATAAAKIIRADSHFWISSQESSPFGIRFRRVEYHQKHLMTSAEMDRQTFSWCRSWFPVCVTYMFFEHGPPTFISATVELTLKSRNIVFTVFRLSHLLNRIIKISLFGDPFLLSAAR